MLRDSLTAVFKGHIGRPVATGILMICMSMLAYPAMAATYYIDFSSGADTNSGTTKAAPWKHAPGMNGCANNCAAHKPAPGDVFTFKGGVTWTGSFPWTLSGGSAGNPVTYTTDHSWFAGGSYTQPTFDDQHGNPGATGMVNTSNIGFFVINDAHFINCGTTYVADGSKCLVFENAHDASLTNNVFSTASWIGVYFIFDSPGSYSNFTFTGNDFSNNTGAIWFASAQPGTKEHNINYNNNTFHDYASMLGGGAHGDGAMHFFIVPNNDNTEGMDGFTFCNNRFYGDFTRGIGGSDAEDMTGLIYLEGPVQGTICNNQFAFSPTQNASGTPSIFEAIIDHRVYGATGASGLKILNNSIYGDISAHSHSAAILLSGVSNVTVENNIVVSGTYCAYGETGPVPGLVSDYNEWDCPNNGFMTYGTEGPHSLMTPQVSGNPSSHPAWTAPPQTLALSSSSPGKGAGLNLAGLGIPMLKSDLAGITRGSAWDIGAYQLNGAAPSGPQPPTNLVVTTVK